MKRSIFVKVVILAAVLIVMGALPVDAALYKSYLFDAWGVPMPTPEPYLPVQVIFGSDIGAGDFRSPQDIFRAHDGTLYIVDSGNNRIVKTTSGFEVVRIYQEFDNNGVKDTFNNPQSVFVTAEGEIYIADTNRERIVRLKQDGELISIIGAPKTDNPDAFPRHFRFRPKRIAVDRFDRLYVIVEGLYEGLMELDLEGNFRTFTGAPRVSPTVWEYFWYRIASEEQRSRRRLFLPTEYSSMHLDADGFMLTTISGGEVQDDHFVRKLNPAGVDILKREGLHPVMGDLRPGMGTSLEGNSRFVDVVGRENDIYSVLDQQRGRIFTYDGQGNLLYVFGGLGQGVGLFSRPVAIEAVGDQLLVIDSRTNSITVFAPTEYAKLIHTALDLYNRGKYDEATEVWQQVVKLNANNELAFSGMGDSELSKGNFEQAMLYYRLGSNREGYSKAFYRYRREVIGANFGKIMTAALVIIAVLSIGAKLQWRTKFKERFRSSQAAAALASERVQGNRLVIYLRKTWQALRFAKHVIFHPFDGFWDLKYEKRGTSSAATILLILVVISYIFMRQYTGFVLNYNRIEDLNIIVEATSLLGPFILWCVVNWALTTLMDGKGKMKDIYIAGAYALTPMILINFPITIISNYMTIEEGTFYYLLLVVGVVWAMTLLILGTGVIHEYSFGKTIFTTLATIVGIGIVIFVGLLFFHVIDMMFNFVREMYVELTFRL